MLVTDIAVERVISLAAESFRDLIEQMTGLDSHSKCDTDIFGIVMGTEYTHLELDDRFQLRRLMEVGL